MRKGDHLQNSTEPSSWCTLVYIPASVNPCVIRYTNDCCKLILFPKYRIAKHLSNALALPLV